VIRPRVSGLILALLVIGRSLLFVESAAAQDPPPDVRFGAVEAFWDPVAAAEAGVGWDRILFYWSELQPNGPEDWNGYHVPDDWLALATQQGREVIGLIKHTPAWATEGPVGCGVPKGLDLPVDDPGNLWANFVRRVVQAYSGRINHWVIWNEPDIDLETYGNEWCGSVESYYRLLKVAYLVAHEVNPDVQIHLAGLTFWHDQNYLQQFLDHAVQDPTGPEHGYYFDVVTVHIYFRTESVPQVINQARSTIEVHGLQKPIWVNETNASPDSDPEWPLVRPRWRVSIEEQASFLLQSFALALSSGAERIGVYKLKDVGLPPGGEPFGLIRPDGSRRPAFEAYKLITRHYAGTVSAREERRALYEVVILNRGDATTRVLWARKDTDVAVIVPALAPEARLIDQTGAEQQLSAQDGTYALTLPAARCADEYAGCIIGGPAYLLVEGASGTVPPMATDVPVPAETPVVTPTAAIVPTAAVVPTASVTSTVAVTATVDLTSTSTVTSVPPTASPTPTPLPTETPTPTPTAIATATKTPTSTPSPTPTAAPTETPSPTATSRPPTPTATPSPVGVLSPGLLPSPALIVVASLLASAAVIGVWFSRLRRR
jgi:hypothetical protein